MVRNRCRVASSRSGADPPQVNRIQDSKSSRNLEGLSRCCETFVDGSQNPARGVMSAARLVEAIVPMCHGKVRSDYPNTIWKEQVTDSPQSLCRGPLSNCRSAVCASELKQNTRCHSRRRKGEPLAMTPLVTPCDLTKLRSKTSVDEGTKE